MVVNFYHLTFNRNHVVKTVGTPVVLTVSIKDPCDLHDPVLRLVHDASHMQFNYAYIPDFGRYYYVDPPELDGKEDIFALHVDVLMSYSNDIKNSNVIASRSNFNNKQFDDNMVKPETDKFIEYRQLSQPLTGETYVAIIGG